MTLVLYGHPFSSYTQKVLIALYEAGTAFDFRLIDPTEPGNVVEWQRLWPIGKFPVLVDDGRMVAETSIIIEYLGQTHPDARPLIPADPAAALQVRFLDRVFDQHVMNAAQHAVDGALTGDPARRTEGEALARRKLSVSYAWLEHEIDGRTWAAGDDFTMADCAAAPALFYADWIHPIPEDCPQLRAYRARLLAHPSVARAVEGGRPFRHLFPLGAPDRD